MNSIVEQLDAWLAGLIFAVSMLAFWTIGWQVGRRMPNETGEDPGRKFTDASMALLGLLLAFTFSMALSRHDQRRQAAIDDCNSIGDVYTCASLLKEPARSQLQSVVHAYAELKLDFARQSTLEIRRQEEVRRFMEMQSKMTELVASAIAEGTPIAVPLTNSLNNLSSRNAALLAAYEARLPRTIVGLLLLGAIVPALLMGLQQGCSKSIHLSGTFSFIILVTFVIFVTLDLNLPSKGLIRIRYESLDRLIQSMGK